MKDCSTCPSSRPEPARRTYFRRCSHPWYRLASSAMLDALQPSTSTTYSSRRATKSSSRVSATQPQDYGQPTSNPRQYSPPHNTSPCLPSLPKPLENASLSYMRAPEHQFYLPFDMRSKQDTTPPDQSSLPPESTSTSLNQEQRSKVTSISNGNTHSPPNQNQNQTNHSSSQEQQSPLQNNSQSPLKNDATMFS